MFLGSVQGLLAASQYSSAEELKVIANDDYVRKGVPQLGVLFQVYVTYSEKLSVYFYIFNVNERNKELAEYGFNYFATKTLFTPEELSMLYRTVRPKFLTAIVPLGQEPMQVIYSKLKNYQTSSYFEYSEESNVIMQLNVNTEKPVAYGSTQIL